jgi:hypothetical protein
LMGAGAGRQKRRFIDWVGQTDLQGAGCDGYGAQDRDLWKGEGEMLETRWEREPAVAAAAAGKLGRSWVLQRAAAVWVVEDWRIVGAAAAVGRAVS